MVGNIYDINSWKQIVNPNTNEGASLEAKKTTLFVSTLVRLASILWPLDPSSIVVDLEARRKISTAIKNSNTEILEKLPPEQIWWEQDYQKVA